MTKYPMMLGKHKTVTSLTAVAIIIGVCVGAAVILTRPDLDTTRVPLGVEQAAIVTYSGPALAVAPYKWGVAVNVRIAEVVEQSDRRVYDIRYIVNRAGTFDLRDYLASADGSETVGLPEFQFTGDPKLSQDLDTRIQDTEGVSVDVGGRYYETLIALAALWIGWLLLLIFWKRPKPPAETDLGPSQPSLAEQVTELLAQLRTDGLDTAEKAKLEMTLLQYWRAELTVEDQSMSAALREIHRDSRFHEPLKKLQLWLHQNGSSISNQEIAAALHPIVAEATAT